MRFPERRWTSPRLELSVLVAGAGPINSTTGRASYTEGGLLTWEYVFGAVAQLAIDLNDGPIRWDGDVIAASNYHDTSAPADPLWPTLAELRTARVVNHRTGWMAWRYTSGGEGFSRESQDFDTSAVARAWVEGGLCNSFPPRTSPAWER